MLTVALPLIPMVHVLDGLTADTVYVPAAVCNPKSIEPPVPDTALPTAVLPLYNW